MNKKILKLLYYLAWAVGIIAVMVLLFGILKSFA